MDVAAEPQAVCRPSILMIEDDPSVRRSMQLLLQGQGFDVKAYEDQAALLAEASLNPPDCLVADYRLKVGSGIQVLEALRRQGWAGPAVLVSAFASQDLAVMALAAGFVQVFEKPLRERALVEAVSRLTGHQGTP